MNLHEINKKCGEKVSDSTIRWFALAILEETQGEAVRLGEDDFAVILSYPERLSSFMSKLYRR